MPAEDPRVVLRLQAESLLADLATKPTDAKVAEGRQLTNQLRKKRDFPTVIRVAEAVLRQTPDDATTRRMYAQALIESGYAVVAIDVLKPLLKHPTEATEAWGLTGRANKQIFFDAGDKASPAATQALERAVAAYRVPFKASPKKNYWHGVNLVAVLTAARRLRLEIAPDLDPIALASRLIKVLGTIPVAERDPWYHATVAEANLALGNWPVVDRELQIYLTADGVDAFELGSTLRQFSQVWGLAADGHPGRPLVDLLRAQAMKLPGASLDLEPADIRRLAAPQAAGPRPEAVLGIDGPKTYQWMQNGMRRALSVGAVRRKSDGRRHGTAFLVRAEDLGIAGGGLIVITNSHVVNPDGSGIGIRPTNAQVQFEALDNAQRYDVAELLWSSPQDVLDASVLRLAGLPAGLAPLDLSPALPVLDEKPRVYAIGHPGGDELALSFQDNELIDHEGAPNGVPVVAGRIRLHYRTPTKEGSSGSPVFNDDWEVIGLHHFGGKLGVEQLNGKPGTYAANEGIWIQSIVAAAK
jgi:hypothetical protein